MTTSSESRHPILFLDIDDVLCLNDPFGGYDAIKVVAGRHRHAAAVYRELFAPAAREALSAIHRRMDGKVRYVLSSSWRTHFDRASLARLFAQTGLPFVFEDTQDALRWCTPQLSTGDDRQAEIAAWLDEHGRGEPFAILDDTYSGDPLVAALRQPGHRFAGRVVLCKENVGLQAQHVAPLVAALRRP